VLSVATDLSAIERLAAAAEGRRLFADYDTGSISIEEAALLQALVEDHHARIIVEVGTFIGLSTTALASAPCVEALYTCDASNDCLQSTDVIHTYPKRTSTSMFRDLLKRNVRADLCFFDGVLPVEDVELLLRLTHPQTVYAFHDYNYGPKIRHGKHGTTYLETMPRKGIGNVRLLHAHLPQHVLIEPPAGTTLALLMPESRP